MILELPDEVRILVAAPVAIDIRAKLIAGLPIVRLSHTDKFNLSEVASVEDNVRVVVSVAIFVLVYCAKIVIKMNS